MSVCVGVAELSEDLQTQVPSFISCLFAQGAAGDGYAGPAKRVPRLQGAAQVRDLTVSEYRTPGVEAFQCPSLDGTVFRPGRRA